MLPLKTNFPLNANVRFTQERLSLLAPRDRQGLEGRVGVVQTDGNVIRKPTVYFPAEGARQELRLFRVDPRHLEQVESTPESEAAFAVEEPMDSVNTETSTDEQVTPPGSGDKLSQSDMDALFG